jgi:hypothetical protein
MRERGQDSFQQIAIQGLHPQRMKVFCRCTGGVNPAPTSPCGTFVL